MNKLEKLIAELCPDGVEYKPLGEVLGYEQPGKYIVRSTDYDDSYDTPVLTAGQTFILGYTDEQDGHYPAAKESPVIIFDDFTTAIQWVDFEFKVKSSAMKLLTLQKDAAANLRYVYCAMRCINYTPSDHSRHWIEKYSKFEIPLPPLPVQQEIVRMLDGMAGLIGELESELAARRKQYEWYRDRILGGTSVGADVLISPEAKPSLRSKSLEVCGPQRWPMVKLGDVFVSHDKKRVPLSAAQRNNRRGPYRYYGAQDVVDYVDEYIFDGRYMLIAEDGENLRSCKLPIAQIVEGQFWVNNHAHVVQTNEMALLDYVLVVFNTIDISRYITGAAQPKLNQANLNSIKIPLPPLADQKRIVEKLDAFDKLCNSTTEGLPAEIAARKKQYEYYRDRLLTFKRKAG